jgi:phosphoribosylanthranilate isomerase
MVEPFRLPRIKVCGIASLADVAGVLTEIDAVGLVAWDRSPRFLDASRAARVVAGLPASVLPVAVMVDKTPREAERWAREVGARAVQLCGGEAPEPWQDFALPILRRVPVVPGAEAVIEAWRGIAAGFVLDDPEEPGGTGRTVDLVLAARLASIAPCLLAGGLDAKNVAARVAFVRPAGVDASSRLESRPGRKDPARVEAFVRAARAALDEAGGL